MQVPSMFQPVLSRLKSDSRGYFASDRVDFEALAAQARRGSNLLHMRVRTEGEEYGAFLKIYRKGNDDPATLSRLQVRVNRDYSTTLSVHDALNGDPRLGAVYPIAAFPEYLAIITRQAAGLPLGRTIEDRVRW